VPKVADAHLAARRQAILEAACEVFSTKGMKSATMADVALRAGISPGAIYRYFASKHDLARLCMSDAAQMVKSRWVAPLAPGEDPLQGIMELSRLTFELLSTPAERANTILMLERILSAVRENDESTLHMFHEENADAVAGVREHFAAARENGEVPADLDPRLFAEAMLSFYWGSRLTRLLDPGADTGGHLNQLLDLLVRAGAASQNS
jgi:AcrR family transcriptional regulator